MNQNNAESESLKGIEAPRTDQAPAAGTSPAAGHSPKRWQPEVAEALRLIDEARTLLKHGQADRALWRLVDAAGLTAEAIGPSAEPIAGRDEVTGRGFRLATEVNDESEVVA